MSDRAGSPSEVVDLRSDTVTRPDHAMLEAMVHAPLGDDVFGDDPTVRALEARAAGLTGKEAALLVPSGTMGNSIAVAVHCRPGDEVLLEESCHTFNFECGSPARLWGVQTRPLPGQRGRMDLDAMEQAVRPTDDIHVPRTSLVILEQTSNLSGGAVLPLDYLEAVRSLCGRHGLKLHIDGARIFNASVATGVPVREYARCADTVMFCLSKGLGAPAGSVLSGSAPLIDAGRRVRKLLGGGMRQAGVLAACGLHALEHHVDRLAEDHRRARELADTLAEWTPRGLRIEPPETNMVYLSWPGTSFGRYETFIRELEARGVLAIALPQTGVRLVYHKDVTEDGARRAADAIRSVLARTLR